MTTLAALTSDFVASETAPLPDRPKQDWPLMCDLGSFRAGVPDALIAWRKARGEALPLPSDPDFLK